MFIFYAYFGFKYDIQSRDIFMSVEYFDISMLQSPIPRLFAPHQTNTDAQ